jgi:hypothetical protein
MKLKLSPQRREGAKDAKKKKIGIDLLCVTSRSLRLCGEY